MSQRIHVPPSPGISRRSSLAMVIATLLFSIIGGVAKSQVQSTPKVAGYASSSVIGCLPVGSNYLGNGHSPSPYWIEQPVVLDWTGDAASAELVAYEFNAAGQWGHDIYVNGHKIGTATASRNDESACKGFQGRDPLSWSIDPAFLVQGQNTLRITVDSALDDQSWGLSRAQIVVHGPNVGGPRFEQVTIPSTYYFNWNGYQNEGTWAYVRMPGQYNGSEATPLLITTHGYNSNGEEILLDFATAAEEKGWLVASTDHHGEVNLGYQDFWDLNPEGRPRIRAGLHTMGSRASQYDVIDVVNYMKAHYAVDASRIYLVGHSMGGLTALLTGAKWPQVFAAVVSDSGPTELVEWEYDTRTSDPPGLTPNAAINISIQEETGAFDQDDHILRETRRPYKYGFEYARRSPQEFALNFKHLPLLLQHPQNDNKVAPHLAEDMYIQTQYNAPDHVELKWFPGNHDQPVAGRAVGILDWLSGFQRDPNVAPQHNTFTMDESGRVFWIGVQLSSNAVSVDPVNYGLRTEAHFTRVHAATYDTRGRRINADVENLTPDTGAPDGGAYPPKDLTVNLSFYLDQIGLPVSGTYTIERINKDTGEFTLTYATAAAGILQVPVPKGTFLYSIVAGNNPPTYRTLVLQQDNQGYRGATDTMLSDWYQDTNYGAAPTLNVRNDYDYPTMKSLLRFDLSSLPAGAQVRFAVFNVKVTSAASAGQMLTELFQINRSWDEVTATWNRPATGATWSAAGAEGVPGDRAATPSDTRNITTSHRYGFDILPMLQQWRANPNSNYGMMLRCAPTQSQDTRTRSQFELASSNYYWGDTEKPQLTIVYTLDTPTPTPTNTPTPTATFTPTPTSTNTPTATPTPPNGDISGQVFIDTDRDGVLDPDEHGQPGIIVWLKQNDTLQRTTTTGTNGLFTFDATPLGPWGVEANVPPGYLVTTPGGNPIAVQVTPGGHVDVLFGLALAPTATPTNTATATPTATPTETPTATATPLPRRYLPLVSG